MTNGVAWLRQNDDDAQLAFAAGDTLWGEVQHLRALQLTIVVLLPVLLALCAQHWSSVSIVALVASYVGLAAAVADEAIFNRLIIEKRREAAQAQDRFDAIALSLPRSPDRARDDSYLERLTLLARAQDPKRLERNRDWYTPALGGLPIEPGRLACMRESATWDDVLRIRWSTFVLTTALVVILCFATWGVLTHQTMDVALTGIAVPLTPALIWSLREFREQSDAARCRFEAFTQ